MGKERQMAMQVATAQKTARLELTIAELEPGHGLKWRMLGKPLVLGSLVCS